MQSDRHVDGWVMAQLPSVPADLAVPLATVSCDAEPIHVPGSIQPHGLLLVADHGTLRIIGGAGQIEERLAQDWLGRPLRDIIGRDGADALRAHMDRVRFSQRLPEVTGRNERFGASFNRAGNLVLVELEPRDENEGLLTPTLDWLDESATAFDAAENLTELCATAARIFRSLTGFDRVMVYRSSLTAPAP